MNTHFLIPVMRDTLARSLFETAFSTVTGGGHGFGLRITRAAGAATVRICHGSPGLRTGFGLALMEEMTESGTWTCECRGLFRLERVRHTALDEFAKWCTWFAGSATVSHYSAADLHGLGHLQPRFIHLSVAHPLAAPTRQVALHRLPLADDECEQIGPIRITTPLRTVHDLASVEFLKSCSTK